MKKLLNKCTYFLFFEKYVHIEEILLRRPIILAFNLSKLAVYHWWFCRILKIMNFLGSKIKKSISLYLIRWYTKELFLKIDSRTSTVIREIRVLHIILHKNCIKNNRKFKIWSSFIIFWRLWSPSSQVRFLRPNTAGSGLQALALLFAEEIMKVCMMPAQINDSRKLHLISFQKKIEVSNLFPILESGS